MYVLGVALPSPPGAGTAALGLLLVVLLLLSGGWIVSLRRKALRQAAELATIKGKLAERSVVLVQTEQRAQKLEKAVSKQSAAILQAAHELRSPAASIYNTLDVLLQGYSGGAPPKQVEMLCLVRDRAGAMLGMLNDCLSLGAIQSTKAEKQVLPLQVEDVLWRVASGMRIKATLKGIDLTLEVPDALPPVGAVEEHIAQLLSNLLDNAIKYTDRGGKVTAILREDCGYVVGTVEDTGIGIPPQDMSRIFEEFFRAENAKRAEPYGSGLGLPLVKRVVELYGGQLQVESELGVGTKFTFILPAFEATGQAEAGASTILAVE